MVRQLSAGARQRAWSARGPVLQSALAAGVAWWFAHHVLGHAQPFFAPIAATISLSTNRLKRSARIAQMVAGVLLGIVVGVGFAETVGTSTFALALVVAVTLTVTLLAGAGFIGDGMMFSNQAAASAILVVTLHKHGTGPERALDAVVGGLCALLIGVVLFPAEPLALLASAERGLLETLAGVLEALSERLAAGRPPGDRWALEAIGQIRRALGALAAARSTAAVNVRVAPRRWRLRSTVAMESRRISRLDLLTSSVLGLVRGGADGFGADLFTEPATAIAQAESLATSAAQIAALADVLRSLATTPPPWDAAVSARLARGLDRVAADGAPPAPALAAVLPQIAIDVEGAIKERP